jgi:hypothetical protein
MEKLIKVCTVSKADVFHKELNRIIFSVEASHANHRVVTFESKNLELRNAINKVEHGSVKEAHEYIAGLQ